MAPAHTPTPSRCWLALGLLLMLAWIGAVLAILAWDDPQPDQPTTRAAAYPSPPPITFVSPTPYPTDPATAIPVSEALDGQPAPDVTLTTLDGEPVRLHDLAGQIVFLNVWATWCEPCRAEMPALQALVDEYSAGGVQVIAVTDPTAGQTEADVRAFVDDFGLTLTVALSSDHDLYHALGAEQIPTTVIIDRAGTMRARHIGPLDADAIAGYLDTLGVNVSDKSPG
ncbi:MAG: TlpA family protein disulfide reductase [Anaerolineae bacterium]|nr:TlpA family protein disulfide reductase [Anaerolineae bacterium]